MFKYLIFIILKFYSEFIDFHTYVETKKIIVYTKIKDLFWVPNHSFLLRFSEFHYVLNCLCFIIIYCKKLINLKMFQFKLQIKFKFGEHNGCENNPILKP